MALLNSGFSIDEPTELTVPLEKLIRVGFGVDRDAEIEEIEVELDSPEYDEIVVSEEEDEPEVMFSPGDDEF
jgi:hypothetical protein